MYLKPQMLSAWSPMRFQWRTHRNQIRRLVRQHQFITEQPLGSIGRLFHLPTIQRFMKVATAALGKKRHGVKCRLNAARLQAAKPMFCITTTQNVECLAWAAPIPAGWGSFDTTVVSSAIKQLLETLKLAMSLSMKYLARTGPNLKTEAAIVEVLLAQVST